MNNLPHHYLITGENPTDKTAFLNKIAYHIEHGIKLIQLRAKNISQEAYVDLALAVQKLPKPKDCKVILNTSVKIAQELDADGVHLTSETLFAIKKRPLLKDKLVSAACHNLEQLQKAQAIATDFVTLSPVLLTNTHPEAHPLGFETFSTLCKAISLPVFALGGIKREHLDQVKALGGYGIAAIQALWEQTY